MKMPPEAMPPGAFFNFPALSACPFSLLLFPQFFHRKLRMAVRAGKIRIAEVNCANHLAVFRGKIVVLRFFGTGVHQMMRRFHCECCLAVRAKMLLHEHKDRMRDGVLEDTPHNCAQTIHVIPADQNFEKKCNSNALFAREISLVTQPSFDCEQGINSQVQTVCSNADAVFPVLGIVFCKNERFSLSRKTHVPLWNEPMISHVRLP